MNRWLIWFGIGLVLLVLVLTGDPASGFPQLMVMLFMPWLGITVFAVPIGVTVWLIRGRSSRPSAQGSSVIPR
jgi:hypothetical protein